MDKKIKKAGRHVSQSEGLIFEKSAPGKRGFDAFLKIYEKGVLPRITGDIIALSPPLILEKTHIDQMFDILSGSLKRAA